MVPECELITLRETETGSVSEASRCACQVVLAEAVDTRVDLRISLLHEGLVVGVRLSQNHVLQKRLEQRHFGWSPE